MKRELEQKVRVAGGVNALLARIAGGETIAQLAAQFGVSRPMMSALLNRAAGRERVEAARRESAGALAEECLGIADAATHANDRAARLKIDTRRWLASRFDPEQYGEKAGPLVELNLGQLHLDALKRVEQAVKQGEPLPVLEP